MKKVLVIANFNAGRKRAIRHKKKLLKILQQNTDYYKIVSIENFNPSEIENYDTIVAIGGDGTVNSVLPYIVNTEKTLGIIPTGTANLLAAKLGIPMNYYRALNRLKSGVVSLIDYIDINNEPCILRFGLGYDADIIGKTPQSLKNKFGYFAYFVAGIIFALRLSKKEYTLIYDDKSKSVSAACIIVANAANMYRKFFSVGNNCKLDDGKMDVFILKTNNPISYFIELIFIALGIRVNSKRAEYFQTDCLTVVNGWSVSHVDGEKKKYRDYIKFEVVPKAIKVIC